MITEHTNPRPAIRETILLACLLVAVCVALDVLFYPHTLEDAFITFRYSEHLAGGYGFGAWNTDGTRVEGYSTFLWMLVLAGAKSVGLSVVTAAKALGIASHAALVLLMLCFPLVARLAPDAPDTPLGQHRDVFTLAAILLATYLPLAWYATTGMETVSFALLVALALLGPFMTGRAAPLAAINIALVLMRPEGLLFALACNAFHVVYRRANGQPVRPALVALAAAAGTFLTLTVFRLALFGDILPNTYYAKVAGSGEVHLQAGRDYLFGALEGWTAYHTAWVLLLVAAFAFCVASISGAGLRANLLPVFLLLVVGVYGIYIWRVGGDNRYAFPYWRHVLHALPLVALLACAGIVAMLPRHRVLRFLALAVVLIAVNRQVLQVYQGTLLRDVQQGLAHYPSLADRPHRPYFLWLKHLAGPQTTIASSFGGELPYVVDAVHIDMLGLNDYAIAHGGHFDPNGPIDSKTYMAAVLARRPDIVEGYLSGRGIVQRLPRSKIVRGRAQMVTEMLDTEIFRTEYCFLENGPYDDLDRSLFLRIAYWQQHPRKTDLRCTPLTETTLYK